MVTIKSKTIKTAHFESVIIKAIKEVSAVPDGAAIPKKDVLELLRYVHNNCLEYETEKPNDDFKILKELQK